MRACVCVYDGHHAQGLLQIARDLVRRRYLQTQQVSERTMSQNVREKAHEERAGGLFGVVCWGLLNSGAYFRRECARARCRYHRLHLLFTHHAGKTGAK